MVDSMKSHSVPPTQAPQNQVVLFIYLFFLQKHYYNK